MIEVTNLSTITDTESFRVDGRGNAKLLVVQCVLDRHPEIPTLDPIRDLKFQLHELKTEKAAREQEVAILKGFGGNMAEKPDLTPYQARTFSDTLFDKIFACAEMTKSISDPDRGLGFVSASCFPEGKRPFCPPPRTHFVRTCLREVLLYHIPCPSCLRVSPWFFGSILVHPFFAHSHAVLN